MRLGTALAHAVAHGKCMYIASTGSLMHDERQLLQARCRCSYNAVHKSIIWQQTLLEVCPIASQRNLACVGIYRLWPWTLRSGHPPTLPGLSALGLGHYGPSGQLEPLAAQANCPITARSSVEPPTPSPCSQPCQQGFAIMRVGSDQGRDTPPPIPKSPKPGPSCSSLWSG